MIVHLYNLPFLIIYLITNPSMLRMSFLYRLTTISIFLIQINRIVRFDMLFKSKSNRGLIKSQDFTMQSISTLSKVLLAQSDTTKYIGKQIKNEVQLSQKNERNIDKSIIKIKEDAQSLIRRYEQEKEMNQKLEFLVKNIEEELYQTKLDKSTDLKANIETDKLLECSNILDNKQKDLQKISEKINSSSYDLSKKLDSIRALRSERTIFSTLFDKIERELCDLEHCYQVLVIERNIGQQIYKQSVDQFSKQEATTNRQLEKLNRKVEESLREQQSSKQLKLNGKTNLPNDNMKRNSTVTTNANEELTQKGNPLSEFYKEKVKQKKSKLQIDFQKLKRERIVKIILNDLAISSVQELPSNLQKLQENNEQLLKEATNLYDQILIIQQNITHLTKRKKKNNSKNIKTNIRQDKKHLILQTIKSINQSHSQVNQFRQICKILIKDIKQSSKNNEINLNFDLLNEEEEIRYLMGELQTFLQNSYQQNKNQLPKTRQRESLPPKRMTYFMNHLLNSHMAICQEKELLDFAKNNMQKIDRRISKIQK